MLHEPKLDAYRRRQAAQALIELDQPQATKQLLDALDPAGDPYTQQLIAQALVTTPQTPPAGFASALFKLLAVAQQPLLGEVAEALGRFQEDKLIQKLIDVAQNPSVAVKLRVGVILSLGYHRQQEVAGALVGLVQSDTPIAVREAAGKALVNLTGIDHYEAPHQWTRWWAQHQRLSKLQWQEALVDYLTRRNERLSKQAQHIEDRLVEVQRQLYRMMPQADRPAMLVVMLGDPLGSVRQLAINLCVQRLIDTQPIEEPLREALRASLDDPATGNRERAALLLRDLADKSAADMIAQRLNQDPPTAPGVQRAYLLMMARLPRAAAVERALAWLNDPDVGSEAAGALTAAAGESLLTPDQANQAAQQLRAALREEQVPDPEWVELLGQVGDDQDWQRIAGWLESSHDTVKQTAAQVWGDSSQDLGVLLGYLNDPLIQQTVIAAARNRGKTAETFTTLIEHQPDQEQAAVAWEEAVVAVIGRVEHQVAWGVYPQIAQQGHPLSLQEKALTAMIDHAALPTAGNVPSPNGDTKQSPTGSNGDPSKAPPQAQLTYLVDLLLARAGVRLKAGDTTQAMLDYQSVGSLEDTQSVEQRRRYWLGVLHVRLNQGEPQEAIGWVRSILSENPEAGDDTALIDAVLESFLDTAQRYVAGGQADQAKQLLIEVELLLGHRASKLLQKRLVDFQQQLEQAAEGQPAGENPPPPPESIPDLKIPTISDYGL